MPTFNEKDQLAAEKFLHLSISEDPDSVCAMSWAKLHLERSACRKSLENLLDRAESDNRNLTPDEKNAYDIGKRYLDNIDSEFDRRSIAGVKEPSGGDAPHRVSFKGGNMETNSLFANNTNWRSIFGREPRATEGGINRLGDFLLAVHEGGTDERLKRTMVSSSGSDGGFAIPEQVWSVIFDAGIEASVTLDRCTMLPMQSDTLHVPGWDSADHTAGPVGQVTGSWLGEATDATRVSPKLRLVSYFAHKLGMFIGASAEVLQDSEALARALAPLMRSSLAFNMDAAILTGDSVAKPAGILNSAATVKKTRVTPGNITFTDVTGMLGRLLPGCIGKAVWLTSPSGFAGLLSLETSTGSGQLVLQSTPGPAGALPMTIFGMPLRITEKLPALGTKGDLVLADLSFYGLAVREQGRMERTNSAQWLSDVVDFRLIVRFDGKPLISSPYTPAGGGVTLSPFVVLE
ncbi:MAG: phage major capsid protein [Deltaproteobacteria bacterium]|nr:phage major capsid protein [Deltaproteobacteria bacterium]